MTRIGISLPEDIHKKLEDAAKTKSETVSHYVIEALQAYWAGAPAPQGQPPAPKPSPTPPSAPAPPSTPTPGQPDLAQQVATLQATVAGMQASLTKLNSYIDDLYRQNAEMQKQITALQGDGGVPPGPIPPGPFPNPGGGGGGYPPMPEPPNIPPQWPWLKAQTATKSRTKAGAVDGRVIAFYPNDPMAPNLPLETIPFEEASPDLPPFQIQGILPPPFPYPPGSLEFQKLQLYATLTRALNAWKPAFGGKISWCGGMVLGVNPRAGRDLNAFYDRYKRGLFFFYDIDSGRGKVVFAAESVDVSAHETGHAILDGFRPQLYGAPFPEGAAFHESFGDMTSILTGLSDPMVRNAVLSATGGDLHQPNVAAYLAEEFGQAAYDNYGPQAVMSPEYLRSALNPFRYQDPFNLPSRAPDAQLSSEAHNFSRVFTGAFYDFLAALYERMRKKPQDPDALENARLVASKILLFGIARAALTYNYYESVARGMMAADVTLYQGGHNTILSQVFSKRKILAAAARGELALFGKAAGASKLPKISLPSGILSPEGVPLSGFEKFASRLKGEFGFPEAGPFEFVGATVQPEGTRLEMGSSHLLEVSGPEFGILKGALVEIPGGLITHYSPAGALLSAHASHPDKGMVEKVKAFLLQLVEKQKVEYVPSWQAYDSISMALRRKPWMVMPDPSGAKRLLRAYYA